MNKESKIDFKVIESTHDTLLKEVESTYITSFPDVERRAFPLFKELVDHEPRFKVYALLNEDRYIGFISAWQFETFVYVEHFAIDEGARNGGFGGMAMKRFVEENDDPIVLEVELPEDEICRRRVGFYERLGFQLDDHYYLQPPYREREEWIPMRLMWIGGIDLKSQYDFVKQHIYQYVYQQK